MTEKNLPATGTVVVGYICAVFLPVIGLIIGLVLRRRQNPNARTVIALSIVFGLFMLAGSCANWANEYAHQYGR